MKANKKLYKTLIALCIIVILAIVALPGCDVICITICLSLSVIMAYCMEQLDKSTKSLDRQ